MVGDRRLRLALVHYTAPPIVGGVEKVMGQQARLLREAGHDVRVLAGRGDAVLVPELDSRHPQTEGLLRQLREGAVDDGLFESLRRRIRERLRPALAGRDVVIAHNVLTMAYNLPLGGALLDLDVPLIAWCHDLEDEEIAAPVDAVGILRQAHPGVTYVAISDVRRDQLARRIGLDSEEIALVPNGIDPLCFAGAGARVRGFLADAGALDADPLVLVPQRITRNKRLELTLEAAVQLVPQMPHLRVLVTGPVDPHDPGSRAYAAHLLRRRSALGLEEHVRFNFELGEADGGPVLQDQDLAELYRICDVVLLTSAGEGFGLPLLEAALARVPIACTDLRVFNEISGDRLYTFEGERGDAVAGAIRQALASDVVQHRREILRRFGWSSLAERYDQILYAATGRADGRGALLPERAHEAGRMDHRRLLQLSGQLCEEQDGDHVRRADRGAGRSVSLS